MAPAAELPREGVDVDVAGAAEGHLHLTVAKVTEKHRHPRSRDRSRVLDDAVEVFLTDAVLLECAGVHRQPRETERLIDAERIQHFAEQTHATRGRRGVNADVALLRV